MQNNSSDIYKLCHSNSEELQWVRKEDNPLSFPIDVSIHGNPFNSICIRLRKQVSFLLKGSALKEHNPLQGQLLKTSKSSLAEKAGGLKILTFFAKKLSSRESL